MFNKSIFLLSVMLFSITAFAQSDFDVAQRFMSKKGVSLVKNTVTRTSGGSNNYSIFNGVNNKGFAIVANGAIIGYSTENECDANNLPPQLKAMLDSLPEVKRTRGAVEGRVYPEGYEVRNVTPIKPLITTKWGQGWPYRKYLDWVKGGICSGVAKAQLLHYYRVPYTHIDFVFNSNVIGEMYFPKTTFNHDLMLDNYIEGQYTEEEGEEVAKLYGYVLGWEDSNAAVEIFGMKFVNLLEYKTQPIYNILDSCLETSNPLWAGSPTHAYNIDGRDEDGLYHVNWGWDGISNGYYIFTNTSDKQDELKESSQNKWVSSHRCCCLFMYILLTFSFTPPSSTSIDNSIVEKVVNDGCVYNLQGQRINGSLSKGMYIKDGKKFIVR